ncbi:MAG: diaminopimelate epimerase [Eubacteriales bacterium]|nr:diaminopimelate epimerase [Eubacteriales bacterium]MDD7573485.1 diaminopimelate epimerase [Eubacteriales bacterium]MDY5354932.1 diaminopimelate epimerase [Eubacteriales bacterium]
MVFYKYHGCGNDFVLIDEIKNADYRSLAVRMCERRRGIGADGLIVCSPRPPSMRIFNSDGSEASMCGNGIRCAARYFADTRIVSSEKMSIRTLDGVKTAELCDDGDVLIEMGEAHFGFAGGFCKTHILDGRKVLFYEVFIGCAHAVVFCDDIYRELLFGTAEKLSGCELFPQKINVDIVRVDGRRELTVRTFERGAGYTAACGTGACAAYAVARRLRLCDGEVTVRFELGSLCVSGEEKIKLRGGAERAFKGEWEEI